MLFTDPFFLFYFLPVTLVLLRVLAPTGRLNAPVKGLIIFATLIFYAYENWLWVLIFIAVAGGAYLYGWAIVLARRGGWRTAWLGAAVLHCVLLLSAFKYLNWLSGLFPFLLPVRDWIVPWFGSRGAIVLPPGISFYVFEAISYCFDIYRRKIKPPANPLDFFCFIAMFPRFIAGPIVRYTDLEAQIRDWAGPRFARGLALFAVGLAMKCLLADQFAVFVPYAFDVARPDFLQAWTGVVSYSFQLYFDFWGYSIMATGLGLCLGFEFPDNFRSPYHAASISQLWRRWHITLSFWLRDYVYIPFGGNRVSKWRLQINLMLTMLIGGLWHGANFTFIAWGAYHGVFLGLEHLLGKEKMARLPLWLRKCQTLFLTTAGWALFRSDTIGQAMHVWLGMAGRNGFATKFNPLLLEKNAFSAGLTLLGLFFWFRCEHWLVRSTPLAACEFKRSTQVALWLLLGLSLVVATSSVEIPFLYFQF